MKKIILLLIGLSISSLAFGDFEDKHLKCTLVEKNGEVISERQAESSNEFKKDVLLSKIELKAGYRTYKYFNSDNLNDIYSDNANGVEYKAYIDFAKKLHITYSMKNPLFLKYESVGVSPNDSSFQAQDMREQIDTMNKGKQEILSISNIYSCTEATLLEKIKYKFSK